MKPAAGGRERPGRSLHTQCVVETPDRCPSVILPRESGHRSSPRRARQRQHEHRTAMRHVVVHVAFGLRCARGGGRASALKAGVESRPLSPSDSVARRDVGRRPRARRGLREGGRRVGARSRECCRFTTAMVFSWGQTQLYKRGHKTARGRAQSCICGTLAHNYGRRARYRQSSARKRREYGVMRGTLSTACLLVPFDTKAAS